MLIRDIGISLLVGYWSSVAANLRALLIFSAATSVRFPSTQYDDSVVAFVPPFCRICMYLHPSALTGQRNSSSFVS